MCPALSLAQCSPVVLGWLASLSDALCLHGWDHRHMPPCPELAGQLVFETGSHHVSLAGLILSW